MDKIIETARSGRHSLGRSLSQSKLMVRAFERGKRILPIFFIAVFLFYLVKEARSFQGIDILGMSAKLLAGLSIFLYGM
jgi:hypothetical protein